MVLVHSDGGSRGVDAKWAAEARQQKAGGLQRARRGHAVRPGEISGEGSQGARAEVSAHPK